MWIASEHGDVGGRQDDFVFDAGKHYTFTVTSDDESGNDHVDMTVEDDATLATGDVREVTGIDAGDGQSVGGDLQSPTYTLSGLDASTYYTVYVQSVKGDKTSDWSSVNFTTLNEGELYLYDNQDNSTVLANSVNQTLKITLQGRTLYKDGDWNTLCLPFDVTIADSPLAGEGVDVRTLSTSDFSGGTLTLNFTPAPGQTGAVTTLEAGKPYIIKWTKPDGYDGHESDFDITAPVFPSVTLKSGTTNTTTDDVDFIGTFSPQVIYEDGTEKHNLYLGAGNTLYYPTTEGFEVNSCRAYFVLKNGLTAGEPNPGTPNGVGQFVLNFGDASEETGIVSLSKESGNQGNNPKFLNSLDYYTLDGVRLDGKPTRKGLYIHGGRKVVIK